MWWILAVVLVALVALFTAVYRYNHPRKRSIEAAHQDAAYRSDGMKDYRNDIDSL